MMEPSPHTVSGFDADLGRLRGLVEESGMIAFQAVEKALVALEQRRSDIAAEVIDGDARLDAMQREIGVQATLVFTRRSPLADDLREVIAALKISSVVERIGDYAKSIAKRVLKLDDDGPVVETAAVFPLLGREVAGIVSQAFVAYKERDINLALEVAARDKLIDDLYDDLFRTLLTFMIENPATITECTHMLFVAKNLERIGDHATNVAELTYFAVSGEEMPERLRGGDAAAG